MTVPVALYPPGTRITVQRGRLPMDPALVGRTGLVVEVSSYRHHRCGVVLDGEEQVREFREDELVKIAPATARATG